MTDLELTTAINDIADNTPNTALEMRSILFELMSRQIKAGTIIMKYVTNSYIATNFDVNGLGILEEEGYRIASDFGGRVPVGWEPLKYNNMGVKGGSETHTLTVPQMPHHNHEFGRSAGSDAGGGYVVTGSETLEGGGTFDMLRRGDGEPHNNMQPYIVTLFVIKL